MAASPAPPPTPLTLPDDLLRRAPTRAALTALCAAIQPGGRVGAVRRLRGGIASGMHAVDLIGPGAARRSVVVRRYGAWRLGYEPRVVEREWSTLTALARSNAPTPRPIWHDPTGAIFGCPTLVISRLPGRGSLTPRDWDAWVRQLAEALALLHHAVLTDAELSQLVDQQDELRHLLDRDAPPPSVLGHPAGAEAWATLKRWWPRIPVSPPSLLHGDYWPGNTLWHRGRLSGVVDWEQARRGNPNQDVACCRLDLALMDGPEASERFVRTYEAAAGRRVEYLFFWDLYTVAGAMSYVQEWLKGYHDLGRTDVTPDLAAARLTAFVEDALARAARA